MKTKRAPYESQWTKEQTRPCPGTCGHRHVAKNGPCTKTGCGCYAVSKKTKK